LAARPAPPASQHALAVWLWTLLNAEQQSQALRRWLLAGPPEAVPPPPTTLFRARDVARATPDLGWAGRVRLVAILEVGGDHRTMLAPPHGASLAAALREAILAAVG